MKKAVSKILVLLAAVIAFSLLCGCKASEHISPSDKDFRTLIRSAFRQKDRRQLLS